MDNKPSGDVSPEPISLQPPSFVKRLLVLFFGFNQRSGALWLVTRATI